MNGVVYTCWTNDECEYYHKILNVEKNLKQSSRSATRYQKIIRDANTKFMKDTIKYGLTTVNGHYFDTILPFYVQQGSLTIRSIEVKLSTEKTYLSIKMISLRYSTTTATIIVKICSRNFKLLLIFISLER